MVDNSALNSKLNRLEELVKEGHRKQNTDNAEIIKMLKDIKKRVE